tara:strand:+ start:352 stop:903 length:552 start_codon:yes stop_codon:yes gene_type:complete
MADIHLGKIDFQKNYDKRLKENLELSKLEKVYKESTKKGKLNIDLIWNEKINEIDDVFFYENLSKEKFYNLENNYIIEILDLDKVVDLNCGGKVNSNKAYPKDKLWGTIRLDSNITKLIKYIKSGKILCPPVIIYRPNEYSSGKDIFTICDGNHRIALSRFLGLKTIPFIIKKEEIDKIRKIT